MESQAFIDSINDSLVNLFGTEITGKPIYRVVWSEDQFEKRLMDVTDSGLTLLTPEYRIVPKYRQWIQKQYVLEQLVVVPDANRKELAEIKLSYEPLFVFQNSYTDEYLPPNLQAAKFVIDSLRAATSKTSMRRYVDDEEKNPVEARETRINKMQAELFGEDRVGPLEHGGGVYVQANPDM